MKKLLIGLLVIIAIVVGVAWYGISGAGVFIKEQIEKQGSKYLDTTVTVFSVELALTEGRMTMTDLDVKNPAGFSQADAFSINSITLDLGESLSEPYVVQTVSIDAPEILYEMDASGSGNLLALKNSLQANLPTSDAQPAPAADGPNPLVIIENVTVSNVKLMLNFENLPTGDLAIDTKAYEVTLPTFTAGPIGKPNGMPADQVGMAIVDAMLDNVIKQAKVEAKKRIEAEAKKKVKEKIDKEKDKLLEKATDKLKGLFDKG